MNIAGVEANLYNTLSGLNTEKDTAYRLDKFPNIIKYFPSQSTYRLRVVLKSRMCPLWVIRCFNWDHADLPGMGLFCACLWKKVCLVQFIRHGCHMKGICSFLLHNAPLEKIIYNFPAYTLVDTRVVDIVG